MSKRYRKELRKYKYKKDREKVEGFHESWFMTPIGGMMFVLFGILFSALLGSFLGAVVFLLFAFISVAGMVFIIVRYECLYNKYFS